MEIVTAHAGLKDAQRGAVLAIGNFDGLHRGHAALIDATKKLARRLGRPAAVMTFEPHPRRLFRPDDPPFRITPAAVKARRLAASGIDLLYALPFTWDFASLSAQQFADDILKKGLAPAAIIVGSDFRFGQLRKGTPALLQQAGFDVTVLEKVADEDGAIISSSTIRQALQTGAIDLAADLLGWPWEIEGVVQKGDQRGRALGYPTANIALDETLHPAYGIYASLVRLRDEGERWYKAATNIGIRPMFEVKVGQVESHIFDFDRDIYGQTLIVRPVARLRGEAKFDTLAALTAQMAEDCRQARALLSTVRQ